MTQPGRGDDHINGSSSDQHGHSRHRSSDEVPPTPHEHSRSPRAFPLHNRDRATRRPSQPSATNDAPESYRNVDEVTAQEAMQNLDESEKQGTAGAGVTTRNNEHNAVRSSSRDEMRKTQRSYSIPESIPESHHSHEPAQGALRDRAPRRQATEPPARLEQGPLQRLESNQSQRSRHSWNSDSRTERNERRASRRSSVNYDVPDSWLNVGDVSDTGPVQNVDEDAVYQYRSLEDARARDQQYIRDRNAARRASEGQVPAPKDAPGEQEHSGQGARKVSRWATQIYTISYLIFFSFLGTLARLGLQTLTNYPGAPVFPSVWFNFGGSLVMGFLAEDRMLFRQEWGTSTYEKQIQEAKKQDEESAGSDRPAIDLTAAKKAHVATKKTIPLYIGLATGFCGSFTSFSSFIRDIFLALSNDLPQPGAKTTVPRNGGYSFMAVLAIVIITVTASLSGLFVGAHLAIASEPIIPSLPYQFNRKVMDRLAVLLGWGCWVGALLLTAMPPRDDWRGDATFAMVFAPLGTLVRFYASLWLNGRKPSFPLGTFVVNVFGTAVLGMAWDLQRVPLGGVIGCQVLQGIEDGFCGCLTTVSTWVSELAALRRSHAWTYGMASVLVSLGVMVAVMGGLRWTEGFADLQCVH